MDLVTATVIFELRESRMVDKPFGAIGRAISREKRVKEEEAVRVIGEHVAGYLQGGADKEAEDIELGKEVGLDLEVIGLRWKVARKRAKSKVGVIEEASASSKNSSAQPKVEELKIGLSSPSGNVLFNGSKGQMAAGSICLKAKLCTDCILDHHQS